ncbi:MAG: primosomal protein N' [Ignavibacteriaceae bacterium]|nr:primosomal protein N' [Ignavibacteriaceae bacterium]
MFVEVVFPLPFRNTFTYSVPDDLKRLANPGVRVVVPFGKRTLTGFVINVSKKTEVKGEIKPVLDFLDTTIIFNSELIKFYQWIADYYLCSLGEALKLGVPPGSEVESKRRIINNKEFCAELLNKEKNKDSLKAKILTILSEKSEINFSSLQSIVKKKNIYSMIRNLENQGAVTVLDQVDKPKVKIKKSRYVKLAASVSSVYSILPEIERRSPNQVKILLQLISAKGKSLPLNELLHRTETSSSAAASLYKKRLIEIFEKEIDRKYEDQYSEKSSQIILTAQQVSVIQQIAESIESSAFQTYLLHGVTGSGKTQVYIELIKKVIEKGKNAIIVVPEISLTPQITSRMYNNFGDVVTVLHSRMSAGERFDAWRRILRGNCKVVIGARSALFAPLKEVGIIIVDEEHDHSFKQTDSVPRYNARDAAIMLGNILKCPVVLGSATPSIESMYNAQTGKYKLLSLPERVDDAKLPIINLIDITLEAKKNRMENVFSKTLIDDIASRLKKKEGVIILQNRRGFSTNIYCSDCGEVETCKNCSVPMVYHINGNYIECHYCSDRREVPPACSHCGSLSIKYFGTGTERVEDELAFYFPASVLQRVDSDSITRKKTMGSVLSQFSKGEIDILVGTQMVSKGIDFARVTLVGVISAETTLWMPDFRADERTFQLLTQVAGRAGRSKVKGEVIIQTRNKNNATLQYVVAYDYEGFYKKEITQRQRLGYPPFSHLCLIEAKDEDEGKVKAAMKDFHHQLSNYKKWITITDPSPAVIARIKGSYRYQILIKSLKTVDPGGKILKKAVIDSFTEFNRKSRFRDVKLFFDVDPQSIM